MPNLSIHGSKLIKVASVCESVGIISFSPLYLVGLLKKNELSSTNSWHVGENANCWCCCQVSKNESVIVSIEISSKELDSHRNSSRSSLNRSRVSLFLTLFIVTGKRCPRKETRNPFVIPTVTWPTEPVWHNTCFCAAPVPPSPAVSIHPTPDSQG